MGVVYKGGVVLDNVEHSRFGGIYSNMVFIFYQYFDVCSLSIIVLTAYSRMRKLVLGNAESAMHITMY